MQPREIRKYLYDIQRACRRIGEFVAGKDFGHYVDDPLLQSAVERQFEIIGEAVNQALRVLPSLESSITGSRCIVAFRNRCIHVYADVSAAVVWGVIESDLAKLHDEVTALLSEEAGIPC